MRTEQAIQQAIKALESEIARVQIDADLYDVWSKPQPGELVVMDFRTPARAVASKHRSNCRAAIEVLRHLQAELPAASAQPTLFDLLAEDAA